MSLIASLINNFHVTICSSLNGRAKGAFFYEINLATQFLLQFTMHAHIGKQTYGKASVELYQYVHIRVLALLTTCIGAKEPSLQDGLCLEVFSNLFCHSLCTHNSLNKQFLWANIRTIFETSKTFAFFYRLSS